MRDINILRFFEDPHNQNLAKCCLSFWAATAIGIALSVKTLNVSPTDTTVETLLVADALLVVAGCIENMVEITIHENGSIKGSAMLGLGLGITFGIFVLSADVIQENNTNTPTMGQ